MHNRNANGRLGLTETDQQQQKTRKMKQSTDFSAIQSELAFHYRAKCHHFSVRFQDSGFSLLDILQGKCAVTCCI